jgi:hypothetical protein
MTRIPSHDGDPNRWETKLVRQIESAIKAARLGILHFLSKGVLEHVTFMTKQQL